MPLGYDHTPGGLVVPPGSHEAAVRAALKGFDSRLMLDYAIDAGWGRIVWQVLCRLSPDQPPQVVCRWRDPLTGEPLPLSFQLVEHAKELHVSSRAPKADADAANQRVRDRLAADGDAELEEIAAELVPRLQGKRSAVLPRGLYRRNTAFSDVTGIR